MKLYSEKMKKNALSLVELVVSLAIIATIAGIVLISFTILDRRRLETAARNLMADLYLARQLAVSRHQDYTVSFDQGNDTYTIQDAGGQLLDPARPIYRLRPVDLTATCPTALAFQSPRGSIGLNPLASDIIRLGHAGKHRDIRAYEETGYIRME
ncbi:MAG: hypothetical protein B5M48_01660 [Candidatus Omnitrophica bacterium 4484_213]|nr:MAG: hypothetical protein B5M48_01660 [Candidatus Omnitrophica bacterium 4484_213]